jgi:hypothetical protein
MSIYIFPLNTIYTYNKKYTPASEHSENFSFEEKELGMIPFTEKEFLEGVKKLGYNVYFVGLNDNEVEIIRKEVNILGIGKYIDDMLLFDNVAENSIIISDDVRHKCYIKENCLFFLSVLIFKHIDNYKELTDSNLNNFKNNKPDFIFESARQSINILKHLVENLKNLQQSLDNYLKEVLRVLYFFDVENYRKREVVITTNEIHYIPFITKQNGDLSIYGHVDLFLQRAPYFYLDYKDRCMDIQNELDNKGIISLHNFNVIENMFYRIKVFTYINSFIQKVQSVVNETYKVKLKIPNSQVLNILESDSKDKIKTKLNSIDINYPYIIKPDPCSEHSLFLILSEEGLQKFLDDEKLYKYTKYLVQEFIPHDGVMFKNYYLNKKSLTIVRPSLPNLEGKNLQIKQFEDKCMKFYNEYLYAKTDDSFFDNIEVNTEITKQINYELFDHLAKWFSEIQEVTLFGLDYLYDNKNNIYYILEVNYFPSYREFANELQNEFNTHVLEYYKESKLNNKI